MQRHLNSHDNLKVNLTAASAEWRQLATAQKDGQLAFQSLVRIGLTARNGQLGLPVFSNWKQVA
jgi:hypothetical protein